MNRLPLRWQLACLTAALVGIVLAGAGGAASWHLYREGMEDLNDDIRFVANSLFAAVEEAQGEVDWSNPRQARQILPLANHLYLIEVARPGGEMLYRTRELIDSPLPSPPAGQEFIDVRLNRRLMRVGEFTNGQLVLRVAMGMRAVAQARADSLRGYLIAGPIILLLVAAGSWWIAKRALSPVESIAAGAEQITARHLEKRLPVPAANDELRRLTNVLNHMIDRLEASFRQATRFTADASHELKTPLTIIRGELESALRTGGFAPSQEKLLVNLLEETERLSRILEGLLLLSRADAGHLRVQPARVDLTEQLRELLEDAEILASPAGITIKSYLPERAELLADTNFLRQLLLNLLDNAIKYNEPKGLVEVRLERDGGSWLVKVGNTGPGIGPADAEHLFDRFYRGDEARNATRPGHGLGLSICREIARAHGGEIKLHVSRPGWTEFCVDLPVEVRPGALP